MFVGAIGDTVDNTTNSCVDQYLGTVDAWKMGHVTDCAFGGDPMQRRLDDGICLGMNGPDAMSIHHEVTNLVAVVLPGGGAVEAGGENPFFQDEHTTDKGTVTGASFRNGVGDLHEIGVPVWTHNRCSRCL